MKCVVLIADDFGHSVEANLAIVRAHQEGALTGASLMVGQPGTAHAVDLARAHPTLRVGWHVHLCDGRPVTAPRWPWGESPLRAGLMLGATAGNRRFVAEELAAQWDLFAATGLRCDFVNAHHHLHVHPVVLQALRCVLPAAFDGWLRGFNVRLFGPPASFTPLLSKLASPLGRYALARSGFRVSQTLWGLDRLFTMRADEVHAAWVTLPEGLHEFVFHPRDIDGDPDLEALVELRSLRPTATPSALPLAQRAG